MELKTCEYCGTAYDARLRQCPLCGRAAAGQTGSAEPERTAAAPEKAAQSAPAPERPAPGRRLRQEPGAPKAARGYAGKRLRTGAAAQVQDGSDTPEAPKGGNVYAIPKWMMAAICVILGLAVAAGAVFALYQIGYLDQSFVSLNFQDESTAPIPKETEEQPQKTPEQRYTNEEDYHADPVEEEQKDLSVPCTGVSLDKTAITFQETEQFSNVVVRTEPAGCTEEITFTSADESVATVNQQGKIVAVNGGSTEITATCGAYSAVCLVTCDFARAEDENEADAQLPALSSDDMTFTYPGEQATLLVSNVPEEAEILFSSADESIATVSSSGVITAMSSGTTTVTVQTMGQTLECVVRCSLNGAGADGEETGCTLSNYDVTMGYKGEYFRLTLKDPEGKTITGLVWTSGDTSVCTVDEKGVVTYVAKGTTVVSTTYEGTTYECIVRCIVR